MSTGTRVQQGRNTSIYMVDRGQLRHVHLAAYERLWDTWKGTISITELPENAIGEPVLAGTRLVQVYGEDTIWFIDNDSTRRLVPSMSVPAFSPKLVIRVHLDDLLKYEEGPELR